MAALAASLAAFFLAIALSATAVGAAGLLVLLGSVGSVATEVVLWRRPVVWQALRRLQLDSTMRAGLRDSMLLAVTAAAATRALDAFHTVAPTLAGLWALRTVTVLLQRSSAEKRRLPVSWRNLDVPGVRLSRPWGVGALADVATWPSSGSLPLALGVAVSLLGAPSGWVQAGAVVSFVLAGAVAGLALVDGLRAARDTTADAAVRALAGALEAYAPDLVLYYSRPEAVGYIANVWMPTLEALPHRTVVMVREAYNEPLIQTDSIPVVRVSAANDIERVLPRSVHLALYPSNVAKNNHLIRLPGIFDVFIGHGDSDKGGSATVLTRIFDEAWVSGPAARDRYRVADVGVRDEQVREVGRPQLREIQRHEAPLTESHAGHDEVSSWEYTVLYAPTREGFFASWEYSSVVSQGGVILDTLLRTPGVRVLFKPHPGTGTDDPLFAEEVEQLRGIVRTAGPPHEVVSGVEGLYAAFNRADLLVSDVSSVITDFLASGKPYVVTNPTSMADAEFRAHFPSAQGAYILSGDGSELGRLLQDAWHRDSLSVARARTAAYLLGDTSQPPLERFIDAVDTVLALQRADTARRV
ncbi:hypothetical protein [Pedococcus sp. 5OH_020]|uniref:hypothetical protein n=1 Tax=Pedococcus sp. 5OH_020 TaxID=2989814 RepID=UPI0022E9FF34|nr:hypothetical protein [Pedococcus sp. 5OH_020]